LARVGTTFGGHGRLVVAAGQGHGGQIGAGIDPDGRVELFTRDVTGNLVHRVQLMPGWGASDWTGWTPWKPVTEAGVLN